MQSGAAAFSNHIQIGDIGGAVLIDYDTTAGVMGSRYYGHGIARNIYAEIKAA